jgi:hypothetical protein
MSPVKKSFLDENLFVLEEMRLPMLLKVYKTLIQLETRVEDYNPETLRWDYASDINRVYKEILKREKKRRK